MKKWQAILFIIVIIICLYACIQCIIDPDWYFGKEFVPEYVTSDTFWAYVFGGIK